MKLAVTQMMLGIFITVSALLYSLYGLPTFFKSGTFNVYVMPTEAVSSRHDLCTLILLVLGLAVVGLGIAQIVKTRKKVLVP